MPKSATASSPVLRRTKWLRRSAFLLCGMVGLAGVAGCVGYGWWRRSLPVTHGQVALTGLQAAVDVYRDAAGVPSIFATNRSDALRALGYLHASERFFMMEMNRRAGKGRLAEVVGADMVSLDKFLRTLGLYQRAEQSYTHYAPETQTLFQAYADGVNAWLMTHQKALPVEFTLLGIQPEPWQPTDSLVWGKLMGLRLGANMRDELKRMSLLSVQPKEVVERLYPAYPMTAPITTQPHFARKELPPTTPAPSTTPKQQGALSPALQTAFTSLAAAWPYATPGASNEWVVSGAQTKTGKPILANDPHLGLEAPIMWYLARIVTPDDDLKGATVPGLPVVLLGQNSQIAWGFTTTNSDVQDIFIETLDTKDSTRYLTPDGSVPFITRQEIIKVKGAADIVLHVRGTRHGPVISDADKEASLALKDSQKVLALSFTGLGTEDTTPEALLMMNTAHDWASFQAALQLYQTPPQNIVYADRAGNIGFTNPGLVPVRKDGDGRYPVDGASGAFDYRGLVPFTEIPRLYNPAGGKIVNGNNAVVGQGGLYWFGREWDTPYRAQRISNILAPTTLTSLDDHAQLQSDILSLPAQIMLPYLLKTPATTPQAEQALQLLRRWDFKEQSTRPEALIFEWWMLRLYDHLVRPVFADRGKDLSPSALVLQSLLENPHGWCDKVVVDKSADCQPQITVAFQQTLRELTMRYGQDVSRWQWGAEHYAPLENKVLGHVPGFNQMFGLQHSSDGGFYTVNRGGNFDESTKEHPLIKTHGSGYRALYDLADPSKSRMMIATGQSGHPLSTHYSDFVPLWRHGQSLTVSGTQAELAGSSSEHLTFTPQK
jgi:penicillin amidase